MHGRLKVKTTKEQEEEKRQKRAQKVKQYRAAYGRIVEKRNADEKDEEGLQITQQILEMIPDIHSLWNYRREILEHFRQTESTDERQHRLESERYLTETCLRANPKSYCAWHHRTWIMDAMPAPDWTRELALCTKFLSLDERNFHCWDYRRFVVRRANVPAEKELAFTDEKIAVNFSNYSCWHYRSKLLPLVDPDPLGVRPVREDRHRSELELVQSAAFTDPTDQSAWFYQRWLLGRARPRQAVSRALLSANLSFVALALPARSALELQFVVGSKPVDGTWASADGRDSSSVWVFAPRVPLAVALEGPVLVRPSSGDVEEAALRTAADGRSACLITQPDFGAHFSPGLASVLQDELFALQQLLEFDPDSKWTLLTSVLLMQTIDRHAYHADSLRTLDELVELDYLRANYYKDLKSRLVVEHALEQQRGDEVNLSGLSLTTLYHAELLSLARSVDLSGNRLARVMPNLSSLQCCETLSLDDNDLASLSGWARMPSLRSLSLRNNSLEDVSSLASLTACPALRSLDLRGCPLARAAPDDLKQAVLEVLPDIDTLNGERL